MAWTKHLTRNLPTTFRLRAIISWSHKDWAKNSINYASPVSVVTKLFGKPKQLRYDYHQSFSWSSSEKSYVTDLCRRHRQTVVMRITSSSKKHCQKLWKPCIEGHGILYFYENSVLCAYPGCWWAGKGCCYQACNSMYLTNATTDSSKIKTGTKGKFGHGDQPWIERKNEEEGMDCKRSVMRDNW